MFFDIEKQTQEHVLEIESPSWSEEFYNEYGEIKKSRYKGVKGGRGSGKSHELATMLIDRHIMDNNLCSVCIREIQKSLKFSAKKLIEDKIRSLGVSHLFDIKKDEIRRIGGEGIIIFAGMQDHTADSIKSLEGFDIAWVEEAQSLSKRSLELLRPTIRKKDSEIWFSWNPYLATDAVDQLFNKIDKNDYILITANYYDNPFLPEELRKEAETSKRNDPDNYPNIWLGHHLSRTDDQVFGRKFVMDIIEEDVLESDNRWEGPFFGMDFGFAEDPSTLTKSWVNKEESILYIEKEWGEKHVGNDDLAKESLTSIPEAENYIVRADCSELRLIDHLKKRQRGFDAKRKSKPEDFYFPRIEPCKKWPGSVLEGVKHMQSYKTIMVNPDCKGTCSEMTLYKYKTDKNGTILSDIIDKHNHYIDSIRYALGPMIKDDGYFTDYDNL